MLGSGSVLISGSSTFSNGLAGVCSFVEGATDDLEGKLFDCVIGTLRRFLVNFRLADFCKDIGTIGFVEPSRQIGKF